MSAGNGESRSMTEVLRSAGPPLPAEHTAVEQLLPVRYRRLTQEEVADFDALKLRNNTLEDANRELDEQVKQVMRERDEQVKLLTRERDRLVADLRIEIKRADKFHAIAVACEQSMTTCTKIFIDAAEKFNRSKEEIEGRGPEAAAIVKVGQQ